MKIVLWTIWSSLFSSIFIYLGVGLYVGAVNADTNADYSLLRWVLVVVGLGLTAVYFLLPRFLSGKTQFMITSIIRWFLSDAIAVLGLFLNFINEPKSVFFLFIAWAGLLYLLSAPTAGAIARYATPTGPSDSYNRDDRPSDGQHQKL